MKNKIIFALALTLWTLCLPPVFAALPTNVTFTNFFGSGINLQNPLFFTEMPDKPGYYVVLEQYLGQVSVIYKLPNGNWTKTVMDTVTLGNGVTDQNEMGLLGLAFHPDYAQTHKYYLTYNPTTTMTYLVERQSDSTLIKRNASVASRLLVTIGKPYTNHNGGNIIFGPNDGYLYFGTGDGGSGGDPGNRAQNKDSLQGKFLRIDVDHPSGNKPYGIPADNPFVNNAAYAPEIFALGLRNPWRWSFDALTGQIWLGHVGQDVWESASLVPKGADLGWNIIEGNQCYPPGTMGCNMTGYQLPFSTYNHNATSGFHGNCVIGGYVYRGNPASPFYGVYFMGDNGAGLVWAVKTDGVSIQDSALEGTVANLTTFGTDSHNNLYALSRNGTVYLMGGPDLQAVPILSHKIGKALAPLSGRGTAGLTLYDFQGKRVQDNPGKGVYITRDSKNLPALVPVLQ